MSITIDNTYLGSNTVLIKYVDGSHFVYYKHSVDGWVDWDSNELRLIKEAGQYSKETLDVHKIVDKDKIAYVASYGDDYSVFVSLNKTVVEKL